MFQPTAALTPMPPTAERRSTRASVRDPSYTSRDEERRGAWHLPPAVGRFLLLTGRKCRGLAPCRERYRLFAGRRGATSSWLAAISSRTSPSGTEPPQVTVSQCRLFRWYPG